jgi:polysaccharide pyruvyl transferase WcaK-like protein
MRLPGIELLCICPDPEDASARHDIPAVLMSYRYSKEFKSKMEKRRNTPIVKFFRRLVIRLPLELAEWGKAVRALNGASMLVMTGTGMLGDFGIAPFDLHYQILKWSIVAKLCRCKLLFVSVGAGPIAHPLSRWIVKQAASLADYRSYRDNFSRDFMASLGFNTAKDFVYPDLAFSLPSEHERSAKPKGNSQVIGLGLMDYYGQRTEHNESTYQDYLDKVTTFVAWLLERKYTVRLLIGDVAYDQRIRADVLSLLPTRGPKYEQGQIIDEPVSSVEDIIAQLAATDIVVATRFHNILLALMVGKPVLAISYHEKIASLMAEMGLFEYSQSIDQLNPSLLVKQFIQVEQSADRLKLSIERKVDQYRRALDEQYTRIFNHLAAESRA